MTKLVYSTSFASFVYDDNKIVDKLMFKDQIKNSKLLEEGKELDEEKQLAKKHNAKIIKTTNLTFLNPLRPFKKEFYESSLKIIEDKLRHSLTEDTLIIQTINNIDETMKVANLLSKRLREWYSLYLPEFSKSIESHEKFAEIIIKKSKKELLKELKIKDSIGSELKKEDLDAILNLAKELNIIYSFIESQKEYLEELMQRVCPNITILAGSLIGAKLISIASGLKRLMLFPASTVQLLGAEKALFRHMRNKKHLPPKYGILHEHPMVSQAKQKNKGKTARMLADKISLASKVDYFKGEFVGDRFLKQLKKKLDMLK